MIIMSVIHVHVHHLNQADFGGGNVSFFRMKHHFGTIQVRHMATVFINLFCPKLFQETSHHHVNYHESSDFKNNSTVFTSSCEVT